MTREEALDLLTALSPSEFDETLERLDVPTQYLPGVMAPQVQRAIAAAHYLENHERLDDLQRLHVRPPAHRLPAEAAVTLLRDAGVVGDDAALRTAAAEYDFRADVLGALATYLVDHEAGDIERRTTVEAFTVRDHGDGVTVRIASVPPPGKAARILRRIPVVSDILDLRARRRPARHAAESFLATLGWVVAVMLPCVLQQASGRLDAVPFVALVTRLAAPLAVLGVVLVVLGSRDRRRSCLGPPRQERSAFRYRLEAPARSALKLAAIGIVAILVVGVPALIPVPRPEPRYLVGFLCREGSSEITDGTVEVLDRFRERVDRIPGWIAEGGAFVVELAPWRRRPRWLAVHAAGCEASIALGDGEADKTGCGNEGGPAGVTGMRWAVPCADVDSSGRSP